MSDSDIEIVSSTSKAPPGNIHPPSPVRTRAQSRATRSATAKSGEVASSTEDHTAVPKKPSPVKKAPVKKAAAPPKKVGKGKQKEIAVEDADIEQPPPPPITSDSDFEIIEPTPRPASPLAPVVESEKTPVPSPQVPSQASASRSPTPRLPSQQPSLSSPKPSAPKLKPGQKAKEKPKKKSSAWQEEDDLDDLFLNKPKVKGTAKVAKKREFGSHKSEPITLNLSSSPVGSSSSRSSSPDSTSGPTKTNPLKLPAWATQNVSKSKSRTLSATPASTSPVEVKGDKGKKRMVLEDSEEEEEGSSDDSERRRGLRKEREREKESRRRKKSRSLTPPEPVSELELQMAISALRNNIGPSKIDSSRLNEIPFASSATLHPTLQALHKPDDDEIQIVTDVDHHSLEVMKKAQREKDVRKCKIRVRWMDGGEIEEGRDKGVALPGTGEFEMSIHDKFSAIFATVSHIKFLPPESLVITYHERKVYAFATPSSLKIFGGVETIFAYQKVVYEYVLQRRNEIALEKAREREMEMENPVMDLGEDDNAPGPSQAPRDPSREPSATPGARGGSVANEGAAGGGFKISIRGSATQVLPLMVKPSTTLQKLLENYCKTFKIPVEKTKNGQVWMEFDGEKLDLKLRLEECEDIEEEETIDVREKK